MSGLGAGQLILAYAMKEMGVAVGVVSLALFGVLSIYSLAALAVHTKRVRSTSYPDLIQRVLGTKARFLAEVCLAFYAWGGGVAYLIILKEQLHILLSGGGWQMNSAGYMVALSAACIFPLSLLRKFDRLKFSSFLGCIAAVWITLVVVVAAPWVSSGLDSCALALEVTHVEMVPESAIDYFQAMSLLPFALNMSWAFLNFLPKMRNQTPLRVTGLILGSNSIVLVNYVSIAVIGYLSYCGTITPNVLDSLCRTWRGLAAGVSAVARVALILPLSFSPPIIFSVMRGVINVRLPFSVPCSDHGSDRGLAVGVTSNNVGINTVSSPLCAHLSSSSSSPPR